ncbi:MAG: S-methyl-5'-thioadenosine phosphorylase [Actinobacteria bacterium]|nr:S-methyl-5'-thioadenosine phosphorylase [Actinomycetota bacterium]
MVKIAIIGGSGVYDPRILENTREERVETPYGVAALKVGTYQGEEVGFMPRHGEKHSVPPHKVNYRANIWALKELGVERVMATAAVGSVNPAMKPGDFVIVDDFLDFTKTRVYTFFDGDEMGVVHTDFTEPYCQEVRGVLLRAARELRIPVHDGGVYVCMEGPRYETPAEIRMVQRLGGDLVGMTNAPEVVLAKELGLCYGLVAMVTNLAAGISPVPLAHQEVLAVMDANAEKIKSLAMRTIEVMPRERRCCCRRE